MYNLFVVMALLVSTFFGVDSQNIPVDVAKIVQDKKNNIDESVKKIMDIIASSEQEKSSFLTQERERFDATVPQLQKELLQKKDSSFASMDTLYNDYNAKKSTQGANKAALFAHMMSGIQTVQNTFASYIQTILARLQPYIALSEQVRSRRALSGRKEQEMIKETQQTAYAKELLALTRTLNQYDQEGELLFRAYSVQGIIDLKRWRVFMQTRLDLFNATIDLYKKFDAVQVENELFKLPVIVAQHIVRMIAYDIKITAHLASQYYVDAVAQKGEYQKIYALISAFIERMQGQMGDSLSYDALLTLLQKELSKDDKRIVNAAYSTYMQVMVPLYQKVLSYTSTLSDTLTNEMVSLAQLMHQEIIDVLPHVTLPNSAEIADKAASAVASIALAYARALLAQCSYKNPSIEQRAEVIQYMRLAVDYCTMAHNTIDAQNIQTTIQLLLGVQSVLQEAQAYQGAEVAQQVSELYQKAYVLALQASDSAGAYFAFEHIQKNSADVLKEQFQKNFAAMVSRDQSWFNPLFFSKVSLFSVAEIDIDKELRTIKEAFNEQRTLINRCVVIQNEGNIPAYQEETIKHFLDAMLVVINEADRLRTWHTTTDREMLKNTLDTISNNTAIWSSPFYNPTVFSSISDKALIDESVWYKAVMRFTALILISSLKKVSDGWAKLYGYTLLKLYLSVGLTQQELLVLSNESMVAMRPYKEQIYSQINTISSTSIVSLDTALWAIASLDNKEYESQREKARAVLEQWDTQQATKQDDTVRIVRAMAQRSLLDRAVNEKEKARLQKSLSVFYDSIATSIQQKSGQLIAEQTYDLMQRAEDDLLRLYKVLFSVLAGQNAIFFSIERIDDFFIVRSTPPLDFTVRIAVPYKLLADAYKGLIHNTTRNSFAQVANIGNRASYWYWYAKDTQEIERIYANRAKLFVEDLITTYQTIVLPHSKDTHGIPFRRVAGIDVPGEYLLDHFSLLINPVLQQQIRVDDLMTMKNSAEKNNALLALLSTMYTVQALKEEGIAIEPLINKGAIVASSATDSQVKERLADIQKRVDEYIAFFKKRMQGSDVTLTLEKKSEEGSAPTYALRSSYQPIAPLPYLVRLMNSSPYKAFPVALTYFQWLERLTRKSDTPFVYGTQLLTPAYNEQTHETVQRRIQEAYLSALSQSMARVTFMVKSKDSIDTKEPVLSAEMEQLQKVRTTMQRLQNKQDKESVSFDTAKESFSIVQDYINSALSYVEFASHYRKKGDSSNAFSAECSALYELLGSVALQSLCGDPQNPEYFFSSESGQSGLLADALRYYTLAYSFDAAKKARLLNNVIESSNRAGDLLYEKKNFAGAIPFYTYSFGLLKGIKGASPAGVAKVLLRLIKCSFNEMVPFLIKFTQRLKESIRLTMPDGKTEQLAFKDLIAKVGTCPNPLVDKAYCQAYQDIKNNLIFLLVHLQNMRDWIAIAKSMSFNIQGSVEQEINEYIKALKKEQSLDFQDIVTIENTLKKDSIAAILFNPIKQAENRFEQKQDFAYMVTLISGWVEQLFGAFARLSIRYYLPDVPQQDQLSQVLKLIALTKVNNQVMLDDWFGIL